MAHDTACTHRGCAVMLPFAEVAVMNTNDPHKTHNESRLCCAIFVMAFGAVLVLALALCCALALVSAAPATLGKNVKHPAYFDDYHEDFLARVRKTESFRAEFNASLANNTVKPEVFSNFTSMLKNVDSRFTTKVSRPVNRHVVFLKTHKTGSSTMASVFFRAACRHRLRVFISGNTTGLRFEHVVPWSRETNSRYLHRFETAFQHPPTHHWTLEVPLPTLLDFYQAIIYNPAIVTIVRHPYSHTISHISFRKTPSNLDEFTAMVHKHAPRNALCAGLGLHNRTEIDEFLEQTSQRFSLICILEAFDECLVMMRRMFNWSIKDITYMNILDSSQNM